jgi:hypothetical protein
MTVRREHRFTFNVLILITFFLAVSCRMVSLAPVEEVLEDAGLTRADEGDYRTPDYLGFVDDPAGEPVGFALAGGTEYSTMEGVVSGDFDEFAGGWMPVDSMGYATGFAYLSAPGDDFPFFNATLTPFQDEVYLALVEEAEALTASRDGITVSAEIRQELFSSNQVFVGLTVIQPLHVDPRYADTELEKGLRVQGAFALQAFDQDWVPVDLQEGQAVEVQISLDQNLSPAGVWAVFDPEEAIWREADPACTSPEPAVYTCRLTGLQPLVAAFDVPPDSTETAEEPAAGFSAGGFTLGSLFSIQSGFESGTGSGSGGVDGAIDDIADWFKQQQDQGGEVDPNDPVLKDLIDDLIKAALDEAGANRNEKGKKALVTALQVVQAAGVPGAGAPLEAEMAEISNDVGEDALKESDCGQFRKLLKAAEQIELMGGDMELHRQLVEKAAEMTVDCDRWDGKIRVRMSTVSQHPAGLPMSGQGGNWWETHTVQIWTNVDDHVMHGESRVQHSFPPVKYVEKKECKSEIEMSGSSSKTTIYFEGFYDGYTFQVNDVTPQGGSMIKQHWVMRSKEDDQCQTDLDQTFSFSPFYSLIVHGVSSDSPPINLQEILDTGQADSSSDGLTRFGDYQLITNPDPDLGLYPYQTGFVQWSFFHTEKKLPLEEEGAGQ